jgi:hypothetical protein
MIQACAIVTNLESKADTLKIGDLTLRRITTLNYETFKGFFKTDDLYKDDWVIGKEYPEATLGTPGTPQWLGNIPQDVEDILFLLRLRTAGDISFHGNVVRSEDGKMFAQAPYSVMNSLNRNSAFTSEFQEDQCEAIRDFVNGLPKSQSWGAPWFQIARRYFMHGSGKEYLPQWANVERIVNYGTALEATLTPEQDFTKNRFINRGSLLIADTDRDPEETKERLKELYGHRSTIVHGRDLNEESIDWLTDNAAEIELAVRGILIAGVPKIPPDDAGREKFLSDLYDVEDAKRGQEAYNAFCRINTNEGRVDTIT